MTLTKRGNRENNKFKRKRWGNTWRFWASYLRPNYNTRGNK